MVCLFATYPDERQMIYSSVCRHDCVGGEQHFLSLVSSSETPAVVIPLKRHIVRALRASCNICQARIHYVSPMHIGTLHQQQRRLSLSRTLCPWVTVSRFESFKVSCFKVLWRLHQVFVTFVSFSCTCWFLTCGVFDFFLLCYSGCNQWHNGSFLQWHWVI